MPRVSGDKRCQVCQGTTGAKGARGQKLPRVPGSKAQKVYLGAGFSQELISDRACLLKKVHLVIYWGGWELQNVLKMANF